MTAEPVRRRGALHGAARTLDEKIEPLLELLQPRIKTILWHYRIPPEDAEDLVQEILTSLVRRCEQIHDPEAWLVSALRYQCRLYWRRRRQRLYQLVDATLLEVLGPHQPSPAERLDRRQDFERMMPQIPPRCRSVLKLRYGFGLTPKEIALKMGYAHTGMSKIIKRCLSALTSVLVAGGFHRSGKHA